MSVNALTARKATRAKVKSELDEIRTSEHFKNCTRMLMKHARAMAGSIVTQSEREIALVDTLSNLRHIADTFELEWDDLLRQAHNHYTAELQSHSDIYGEPLTDPVTFFRCAKCGKGPLKASELVTDIGTGPEDGNTFHYCSEFCKESH